MEQNDNNLYFIGKDMVKINQNYDGFGNKIVEIGLTDELINKIYCCANLDDMLYTKDEIFHKIDLLDEEHCRLKHDFHETLKIFQKENRELRQIVARLNTRVNDLIAEKQIKEFYEKNNRECEIARC